VITLKIFHNHVVVVAAATATVAAADNIISVSIFCSADILIQIE
jgi:hypothetical protein